MLRAFVSAAFSLLLIAAAPAPADVVNFDDINVHGSFGSVAADRYRPLGMLFSRDWAIYDFGAVDPNNRTAFINAGASPPNAAILTVSFGSDIDITFVVPGTDTAGTTNHFSILFIDLDPGTPLGTIQAFNAVGALLEMHTVTSPASGAAIMEINSPGTARVHLSTDATGVTADNINFNPPAAPMCRADFNQSGAVDSQDFFDFLAAFFAHLPSADYNHSGAIDSQDFFDFLADFFAGCP